LAKAGPKISVIRLWDMLRLLRLSGATAEGSVFDRSGFKQRRDCVAATRRLRA